MIIAAKDSSGDCSGLDENRLKKVSIILEAIAMKYAKLLSKVQDQMSDSEGFLEEYFAAFSHQQQWRSRH